MRRDRRQMQVRTGEEAAIRAPGRIQGTRLEFLKLVEFLLLIFSGSEDPGLEPLSERDRDFERRIPLHHRPP